MNRLFPPIPRIKDKLSDSHQIDHQVHMGWGASQDGEEGTVTPESQLCPPKGVHRVWLPSRVLLPGLLQGSGTGVLPASCVWGNWVRGEGEKEDGEGERDR